jgi:hypothetical protein
MDSFEKMRPRTSRAQALQRERQLQKQLERLLEAGDEETFKVGLAEEFEIKPDHPKFAEMLRIWRSARRR